MAESKGLNYFARLKDIAQSNNSKNRNSLWSVKRTGEDHSLLISHITHGDMRMFLVAGRQLITSEGLELIALFTKSNFQNKMKIGEAIAEVIDQDGVPVCPWGAGKWLGKRGRVLCNFIDYNPTTSLFLGDNGGRPSIWPWPALLRLREPRNRIISGSDPLPITGDEARVGSFGGYVEGECSFKSPAASLQELLLNPNTEIGKFGRPQRALAFVKAQLNLRLQQMN